MSDWSDHTLMGVALEEGTKALSEREVPIGCVFVVGDPHSPGSHRILSQAHNRTNALYNPTLHAEIVALNAMVAELSTEHSGEVGGGSGSGSGSSTTTTTTTTGATTSVLARLRGKLSKATLYVTVEPCIMCAEALCKAGVGRVVFGCPNDKFGGCGTVLDVAGQGGIKVEAGVRGEEAVALLKSFYARANARAPKEDK